MRFKFAAFLLAICLRVSAEVGLSGDYVRVRPSAPPIVCNNGDLRIASNDSNRLKVCRSNVWVPMIDTSWGQTASVTFGAVTATNFTGAFTGTASYAATSGTASFSSTASVSGLADIAKVSTAFAATPNGCSAGQFAQSIASSGNLTCAQVSFSNLSGTASIAQGGTNNGTLAVTSGGILYADGAKIMNMGAGSSGQAIRSGGTGTPVWRTTLPTIRSLTSGSGTYTTPVNALWLRIRMVGGGGGGGGGGGTGAANGGNGTASTFGSYTAGGGVGGPNAFSGGYVSGGGGTASGCDINIFGGRGNNSPGNPLTNTYGFSGGDSVLGPGGGGGLNGGGAGTAAPANSGGGGGGPGGNSTVTGAAGAGAGAYCEAIVSAPSATYSYVVGGNGTAGGAGAAGGAGGAGGSGIIIIEEFY